ncbi:MAG: hypothetical protein DMD79_11130 [Candidatus Rokuibacteriota bacterium]|nr:MAG: hypothetical protein DMD79_11130 [Candidatus Rokubacteria bacterium]
MGSIKDVFADFGVDGTSRGATAAGVSDSATSPCSRRIGLRSFGGRVATTGRAWIAAGGLMAGPVAGITLAATGRTSSGPCIGLSCRTSAALTRTTWAWPRPNCPPVTPTTALVT